MKGDLAAERVSPGALSAALLMLAMLWALVILMQDFDLDGRLKAVMILGLGVATVSLTLGLDRRDARGHLAGWLPILIVLGLALAVFAAIGPSRLSLAEIGAGTALAATPLVLQAIGIRATIPFRRLPAILTAICLILVIDRLRIFFAFLHFPDMEDIGRTTIAGVHAVLNGQNPYAAPIDVHPEYPDYPGYKYLPMMMAVFAPLTAPFGETGLRVTNLILDGLMSVAILLSARRIGGPVAGLLAVAAWLMLPVIPRDLYKHGVTDLAPVLPLVAALAISGTRLGAAGLLIGLSIAAKLFPGLLMALCCLRRPRVGWYIAGGVIGILPAIAFYLWGPPNFVRNVFQFILSRPIDETSWMYGLPPIMPPIAKMAYFLFLLSVLIHLVTATPGIARRCGLIIFCIVGALLTGPDAHNNYMIWWAPFFCILLGARLSSIIQPTAFQYGERV
jgi:hypothetical protein